MTGSKPTGKVNYLTVDQVEELHSRILDLTGGEHGDLSRSNVEYLLEGVKDVCRRLETNQAIMKKAAHLLFGNWAELGEGVLHLDAFVCQNCGRVQLFADSRTRNSLNR